METGGLHTCSGPFSSSSPRWQSLLFGVVGRVIHAQPTSSDPGKTTSRNGSKRTKQGPYAPQRLLSQRALTPNLRCQLASHAGFETTPRTVPSQFRNEKISIFQSYQHSFAVISHSSSLARQKTPRLAIICLSELAKPGYAEVNKAPSDERSQISTHPSKPSYVEQTHSRKA